MQKNKKRSIGHIRKLENGKYLLRLSLGFDDFGKRIQPSRVVECTSDREAERLLHEFYQEREKLILKNTTNVPKTLGQLYSQWYSNHVTPNLQPTTAEWYSGLWETHLKSVSGIKLEILAPAHIYKILQSIDGDRTKNAVFKTLNAMFNKGVKWGYLASNPCQKVDTPHYEAPEKPVLSQKELKFLTPLIAKEETKFQALYYFAVICGLRRQECVGFQWTDFDFVNDTFIIRNAAAQIDGKTTIKQTKTKKSKRKMYLPPLLKHLLIKLKQEQEQQKRLCGDKWIDGNWVFTRWNGKIMGIKTPSQWWDSFKAKNNFKTDVTFHCLRHTSATHMIKNNVPITTVSGVLGHAKTSTTVNTYAHVIEDTKKDAISVMADIIESAAEYPAPKMKISIRK